MGARLTSGLDKALSSAGLITYLFGRRYIPKDVIYVLEHICSSKLTLTLHYISKPQMVSRERHQALVDSSSRSDEWLSRQFAASIKEGKKPSKPNWKSQQATNKKASLENRNVKREKLRSKLEKRKLDSCIQCSESKGAPHPK